MIVLMAKLQPMTLPVMTRLRREWKTGLRVSSPGYAPHEGVYPDVAETIEASNVLRRSTGVTLRAARWFSSIPLWFLKTHCAELIFERVSGYGECRFVWQ
jgi:hypothetical protein